MRLIDADALKADYGMKDDCADCEKELRGKVKSCEYEHIYTKMDFCGWIDSTPTIEERKTGKWRYSRNISSISYSDMMITCDQCGYTKERSHGDVFNFCPSCGARMEGNT